MRKMLVRVSMLVLVAIGCGITDVCGCPPSYFGTTVEGTLRDAGGAQLPNTRFFFLTRSKSGVFPDPPAFDPGLPASRADGSFASDVMMGFDAGLHQVRAAVYVGPTPVIVDLGEMAFYLNGNGPHAQRDIVLPP